MKEHATDIAFVDMMMPEMDGAQTAAGIIAQRGKTVQLIATSASALDHEQRSYLSRGFDDVCVKPLQLDRICKILSRIHGTRFEPCELSLEETSQTTAGSVPTEFRQRLRDAASIHSVTELKCIVRDIDRLGPRGSSICDALLGHIRQYDFEAIVRLADVSNDAVQAEVLHSS